MTKYRIQLIFLMVMLSLPFVIRAETIDRIIAVVNDDIITLSDLNEQGSLFFDKIAKQVPPEYLDTEMKKAQQEVLKHLIEQLLIEQQSNKFNISITDEEIDQQIDNIVAGNNLTVEEFRKSLQSKGTSEEHFRKNLRDQFTKRRLVNIEINSQIVITEEMIKVYYDANYTAKPGKSGYHIYQIGLLWGNQHETKTKEQAFDHASKVKKLLREGEDFKKIAQSYSDLPSAEDGGDIGVFKNNEIAPYMRDTILQLKPGEISDIIETPSGLQILKLVSASTKDGIQKIPLEEVRREITDILFEEKSEKEYEKWMSGLKSNAIIKNNL